MNSKQLNVLDVKDPKLRLVCIEIKPRDLSRHEVQTEINELIDYVFSTSNKGEKRSDNKPSTVGLSANQVGIPSSISVVDLGIGHKSYSDVHVLINPVITWSSKTIQYKPEGCVNLPEIWGRVPRSYRVKVSALDRSGNKITLDCHGWPAILLQHEIDHLNGKLFIDRLSDPKKADRVKDGQYKEYKKLKENWNHHIDVSDLMAK